MKRIAITLSVLVLLGAGCPLGDGNTITSGSSLRPDNFPGDTSAAPPPSELVFTPALASDLSLLPDGRLTKRHGVGASPCPDPFPPVILPWPDGQEIPGAPPPVFYPETDAAWLSLPETVTPGEPFTPKFNCRISDRSPHQETADVLFRIEGHIGRQADETMKELESDIPTYNLPIKVQALKIELDVE